MRYEIRLAGHLPADWADWFDGFDYPASEARETVLTGTVPDQSALLGLLGTVCRLNLTLLSLRRLEGGNTAADRGVRGLP